MANAKKRRRGVSKIRLTKANKNQFIRTHVANPVVREAWDPRQSAAQNLVKVGILPDPNALEAGPKKPQIAKPPKALPAPVEEIFGGSGETRLVDMPMPPVPSRA